MTPVLRPDFGVFVGWVERFEVESNYDGWRLDRFLTDRLHRASRSKVTRIIKSSVRFEGGRKVKPGSIVRRGDVVLIDRTENLDPETPSFDDVRVIHSSDDFLVLDKPAGMLVHRTAHEATRTVEAYLAHVFPTERIDPLHRLDRDTSGVLLCGRGLDVIREAKALFEESEPEKTYQALVADPTQRWEPKARRAVDVPLGFDASSDVRLRMGAGELPCASHFECISTRDGQALLTVQIERGRQHQIRVHLGMLDTPIVGDKLYQMGDDFFQEWLRRPGSTELVEQLPARWHCLHAWKLKVPWNGTVLEFESAVPEWARPPAA